MNIRNGRWSAGTAYQFDKASRSATHTTGNTATAEHPGVGNNAQKAGWEQFEKLRRRGAPSTGPSTGPEAAASQKAQESFKDQFGKLAGDREKFHGLMKEVYGKDYNAAAAEHFRERALKGDYSWLPRIEFKSNALLGGGNGAFDGSRNVVYINEKFLNDPARAAKVYTEEVGHFLDTQLKTTDTIGDEGEYFRKMLAGEKLSDAEKRSIRSDNDHGTIVVNGKATSVEFSIFDDIVDGAKAVGGAIVGGAKAVGGAIADGAKAVGNAVGKGVKAVGNAIASGAKAVGNGVKTVAGAVWGGIKTGANAVADAAKWIAPRIWDGVTGLATGAWSTGVGIVRNVGEAFGTFAGGLGKIFQGKFAEGFKDLGSGAAKLFFQTPADALLMMGGRTISAIQTMVGLEPVGRKLTEAEITELRKVYGDSIDYSQVRIKEGDAGLFSTTGRAFTHGNTIYIPKDDLPLQSDLLVHEMGHVWQHQNGGTDYMSEALWAQNFGDGYDYAKALGEGKSWSELNPEQQSELLETAYRQGFFDGTGKRFVVNGVDHTDYMNGALKQVRSGQGAP